MRKTSLAILPISPLALAACGSTPTERGVTGGALGAAAGALTDEEDVDLGDAPDIVD